MSMLFFAELFGRMKTGQAFVKQIEQWNKLINRNKMRMLKRSTFVVHGTLSWISDCIIRCDGCLVVFLCVCVCSLDVVAFCRLFIPEQRGVNVRATARSLPGILLRALARFPPTEGPLSTFVYCRADAEGGRNTFLRARWHAYHDSKLGIHQRRSPHSHSHSLVSFGPDCCFLSSALHSNCLY